MKKRRLNQTLAKKRRKKHKSHVEEEELFSSFQLYLVMIQAVLLQFVYFFSGRTDVHRQRRELQKDIFDSLGPHYVRRAYRMHQQDFYYLHSLLQTDLEDFFFHQNQRGPHLWLTHTISKLRLGSALL